jgi:hypothetical protein
MTWTGQPVISNGVLKIVLKLCNVELGRDN